MYENIKKAYVNGKQDIDKCFIAFVNSKTLENKRNEAVNCIYLIGKMIMLSLILHTDFGEDTSEERETMKKVKRYLQFDVLKKLEV